MRAQAENSNDPPNSSNVHEVDEREGAGTATTRDYLRALKYVDALSMCLRNNKNQCEPSLSKRSLKVVIGYQLLKRRVGDLDFSERLADVIAMICQLQKALESGIGKRFQPRHRHIQPCSTSVRVGPGKTEESDVELGEVVQNTGGVSSEIEEIDSSSSEKIKKKG